MQFNCSSKSVFPKCFIRVKLCVLDTVLIFFCVLFRLFHLKFLCCRSCTSSMYCPFRLQIAVSIEPDYTAIMYFYPYFVCVLYSYFCHQVSRVSVW